MPGPAGRLVWGDGLLLRYRYRDGSWLGAFPLRVVEDSPTRVAAWLAEGTGITYWSLDDGADPRTVPLEERFA